LAGGKRIGGGDGSRNHRIEHDVGGKVSPHIINYPVAGGIVRLVHREKNPVQSEPLVYRHDVLDASQDLWRRLECERLAL
jgi:hypothetical protein